MREEAREQRETLHSELVEIKEIVKQQAVIAESQAESIRAQSEDIRQHNATAQAQAESIRLMIEMLNRKQA